mmetsp:Transcript_6290/g.26733  ORF Transcript_6290/g.26733 Transcript_6290/m.26733 type:complete len:200 (+) Transcript_6290:226-825(+)
MRWPRSSCMWTLVETLFWISRAMRAASASEMPPALLSMAVVYIVSSKDVSTPNMDLFAANWSHCAAAAAAPRPPHPPPFAFMAGSSSRPPPSSMPPSASSPAAGAHATSSRSRCSPRVMPPSVNPSAPRLGPTARSVMPTSLALSETRSARATRMEGAGVERCARPALVALSSAIRSSTTRSSFFHSASDGAAEWNTPS